MALKAIVGGAVVGDGGCNGSCGAGRASVCSVEAGESGFETDSMVKWLEMGAFGMDWHWGKRAYWSCILQLNSYQTIERQYRGCGKLTSPFEPILFSFWRRLQNHTRTVSRSISNSSASLEISAELGRELRKNAISSATKQTFYLAYSNAFKMQRDMIAWIGQENTQI